MTKKNLVNQDTLGIPPGYPEPRDILRKHFPIIKDELCIRGGWGYGREDAVIVYSFDEEINPNQHFDGISLENVCIHYRILEEAEFAHEAKYTGINWKLTEQKLLHGDDGIPYDLETVEVTMFTPEDWDFLKNDWESHDGYKDDEEGKLNHEALREERIIRFTEVFWFNVMNILP